MTGTVVLACLVLVGVVVGAAVGAAAPAVAASGRPGPARITGIGGSAPSPRLVAAGARRVRRVAPGPTYQNPVLPVDAPDPDVVHWNGAYYAFTTGSMNGPIQLFVSRDLARWVAASWPGPLVQDAAWATFGQEWAPGVVQLGGQWVLYYATRQTATGAQCITMAVAPAITGPYVNDAAAPLACDAIDPSPVLGADGTPYLTWKADEAGGRQATLVSEALRPDGRTFAPGATPSFLLGADRAWESTVENPDLADVGGHWLLFFSGGDWEDASYATGLATCAGPLGPCADPLDHPVLASTPSVTGPGGASAFRDDRGQWWLAYAAASPGPARDGFGGRLVRSLRVDPLCPGAAPGVDTVVGPSVTPRPLRDPCAATP